MQVTEVLTLLRKQGKNISVTNIFATTDALMKTGKNKIMFGNIQIWPNSTSPINNNWLLKQMNALYPFILN